MNGYRSWIPPVKNNNNEEISGLGLFIFGFSLRLIFSFWGSKYYYGDLRYTFGDSFSYTKSFINLVDKGIYTFDPSHPDAALYRGPIYPFFWGLHYLVFGENSVYQAVAVTQSLLDTLSGLLIYRILKELGVGAKGAALGGFLYLINPISLVHVPITGTETFATIVTLVVLYQTLKVSTPGGYLTVGLLTGVAVMTRQYIGILLPISILCLLFRDGWTIRWREQGLTAGLVTLGFVVAVSPWFLRNYINHDTPTILMGKTTGYKAYQEDFIAFNRFFNLFMVDVTPVYNSIALSGVTGLGEDPRFTPHIDAVNRLARRSFECGPSFISWRDMKHGVTKSNPDAGCKDELASNYEKLRQKFLDEHGPLFLWHVPLQNLEKAVFKSDLTSSRAGLTGWLIWACFLLRSIFVVLGFSAVFFLRKEPRLLMVLFPLFIFLFISSVIRQVEIRYLVQCEAVLMILATYVTAQTYNQLRSLAIK